MDNNYDDDFTINDDGLLIKYYGEKANVIIPEGVTEIGVEAFSRNTDVKSIVIPKSVKKIGYSAFEDCKNLRKVNIPKGVELIDTTTFANCEKLTSVSLPNTLRKIGYRAFYRCKSLRKLKLPNSLISIGGNCFFGCGKLKLTIPKNVSEIGRCVVKFDKGTQQLVMPVGIFDGGNWEKRVKIHPANRHFKIYGHFLLSYDGSTLVNWLGQKKYVTAYIPEKVQGIGGYAFYGDNLRKIIVPKSIVCVADFGFTGGGSRTIYFKGDTKVLLDGNNWNGTDKVVFNYKGY